MDIPAKIVEFDVEDVFADPPPTPVRPQAAVQSSTSSISFLRLDPSYYSENQNLSAGLSIAHMDRSEDYPFAHNAVEALENSFENLSMTMGRPNAAMRMQQTPGTSAGTAPEPQRTRPPFGRLANVIPRRSLALSLKDYLRVLRPDEKEKLLTRGPFVIIHVGDQPTDPKTIPYALLKLFSPEVAGTLNPPTDRASSCFLYISDEHVNAIHVSSVLDWMIRCIDDPTILDRHFNFDADVGNLVGAARAFAIFRMDKQFKAMDNAAFLRFATVPLKIDEVRNFYNVELAAGRQTETYVRLLAYNMKKFSGELGFAWARPMMAFLGLPENSVLAEFWKSRDTDIDAYVEVRLAENVEMRRDQ